MSEPGQSSARELALAELLSGVPMAKLETALSALVGSLLRLRDRAGCVLFGEAGFEAGASAALRLELETVGTLEARAATPALAAAARLLEVVLATRALNEQLERRVAEQVAEIERHQRRLYQAEKLAAVGQIAAGVAHEINNPVSFVTSSLGTLKGYVDRMLALCTAYQELEPALACAPAQRDALARMREEAGLDFLRQDIADLLHESQDGLGRVKRIVQDLRDFSHEDDAEWQDADLNAGLDSTLNVVWNEIESKADVVKEYGALPPVHCIASQINQVFLNLIVNAAQAIADKGSITLRSGTSGGHAWVEVQDSGCGMTPEVQKRIFEPFYTTKPVGKGTGLGLSLAYGIVAKHGGSIDVQSAPGLGSVFRVSLPLAAVQQAARVA